MDYKKRFKNGRYSYIDPAEYKKKDNAADSKLSQTEIIELVFDDMEGSDSLDSSECPWNIFRQEPIQCIRMRIEENLDEDAESAQIEDL